MTEKDYENLCVILVSCGMSPAQINEFALRMVKYYPNMDVDKFNDYAIRLIDVIGNIDKNPVS